MLLGAKCYTYFELVELTRNTITNQGRKLASFLTSNVMVENISHRNSDTNL